MNKTIPKDGKQARQSQDYVPTGPLFEVIYKLKCSEAKARAIARHYGEISDLTDGVSNFKTMPNWNKINLPMAARLKRTFQKRDKGYRSKITVNSDLEGHKKLFELLEPYGWYSGFASRKGSGFNFGSFRRSRIGFEPKAEELEQPETKDLRPPITKRLTGKERKIAKKKRELETKNAKSVE